MEKMIIKFDNEDCSLLRKSSISWLRRRAFGCLIDYIEMEYGQYKKDKIGFNQTSIIYCLPLNYKCTCYKTKTQWIALIWKKKKLK